MRVLQTQRQLKKQDKLIKEMEKLIDNEKKKTAKSSEGSKSAKDEAKQLQKVCSSSIMTNRTYCISMLTYLEGL